MSKLRLRLSISLDGLVRTIAAHDVVHLKFTRG
jgi:hypothetical protein